MTHMTTYLLGIHINSSFEIRQCPTGNDVVIGVVLYQMQWWDAGAPWNPILPIVPWDGHYFFLRFFGQQTNKNQANSDWCFSPAVDRPDFVWGFPLNGIEPHDDLPTFDWSLPQNDKTRTKCISSEASPRTTTKRQPTYERESTHERLHITIFRVSKVIEWSNISMMMMTW